MKRKLSLLLALTLLCTLFAMPASVSAATTGTNYFSRSTTLLNSLYGIETSSTLSSGSCTGDTQSITTVTVYCKVSSGSSRFTLTVESPEGTVASKTCGTSNSTYTFTDFRNEDPNGTWTVSITSLGTVTTVTGTLKVNYTYAYN